MVRRFEACRGHPAGRKSGRQPLDGAKPGVTNLVVPLSFGYPFVMINPLVGRVTLAIYALLLALGGLIGYLRAGSRASLIAGSTSAVCALLAMALSAGNSRLGVPLGLVLSVALFVLFGYRYAVKTRKFMPSGLLSIVSLIVLAVMFLVMDWTWTGP
jgi:uncharacterized membrane protein (UPF0136 family)